MDQRHATQVRLALAAVDRCPLPPEVLDCIPDYEADRWHFRQGIDLDTTREMVRRLVAGLRARGWEPPYEMVVGLREWGGWPSAGDEAAGPDACTDGARDAREG